MVLRNYSDDKGCRMRPLYLWFAGIVWLGCALYGGWVGIFLTDLDWVCYICGCVLGGRVGFSLFLFWYLLYCLLNTLGGRGGIGCICCICLFVLIDLLCCICCVCVRFLCELGGRVGVVYLFLICCLWFICELLVDAIYPVTTRWAGGCFFFWLFFF